MAKPKLYSIIGYYFNGEKDFRTIEKYVLEINGIKQLQNIEKYEEELKEIIPDIKRVCLNLQQYLVAKHTSLSGHEFRETQEKLEKKFTFVKNTPENLETLIHVLAAVDRV